MHSVVQLQDERAFHFWPLWFAMQARLLTIPASMYCEKARWALRLCRVPHIEAGSLPLIHYRRTRPVGARSVPVVLTAAGAALRDSADVMRWCHLGAPPEWTEADMDREAEEVCERACGTTNMPGVRQV